MLVRRHRIFPSLFSEPRQRKYKGKIMYSLGCRVLVATHTPRCWGVQEQQVLAQQLPCLEHHLCFES